MVGLRRATTVRQVLEALQLEKYIPVFLEHVRTLRR